VAWRAALLIGLLVLAGCSGSSQETAVLPEPKVSVSTPIVRDDIEDAEYYTGRTKATDSVQVKARATGYLEKILFEAGAEVKKGQLLFQIDDRTYKADLEKARADVTRLEASVERFASDLNRARRMRMGDAVSREEFDKISAHRDESAALLVGAKATAKRQELNLGFTKVYAPIDGKISQYNVTVGNLVTQDQTTLTSIVSVAPIWAEFDVDERTVLRVQKMVRDGKFKNYRDAKVPVFIGTQIDRGYPHAGFIDFVDNKLNTTTGTLLVRGEFPNTDRALTPGLFVRVRVPLGGKTRGLLVTESALASDQGRKVLYVVNDQNEVEQRAVGLGPLVDGMRVIARGVKAGERVIISGLQRVQQGMKVQVREVPMPRP
jgi:RND family efflux transporter MFP subunit